MAEEMKEGWGDMRPGDRVYHYYVDSFSLCGRVGFYPMNSDHLTAQGQDVFKGKHDCSPCFKKLEKRIAALAKSEKGGK